MVVKKKVAKKKPAVVSIQAPANSTAMLPMADDFNIFPPNVTPAPRVFPKMPADDEPKVFLDGHGAVFLLIADRPGFSRYITIGSKRLELVRLDKGEPPRNKDGERITQETAFVRDLRPYTGRFNFVGAAQYYYDSTLIEKAPDAMAELCKILGKEPPAVSVEVQQKRHEAGVRLQAARREIVGITLASVCEKLSIEPRDARKALRKSTVSKPVDGWVWPTEDEVMAVLRTIGLVKEPAAPAPKPAKKLPADCGRPHPQPLCVCAACVAAKPTQKKSTVTKKPAAKATKKPVATKGKKK